MCSRVVFWSRMSLFVEWCLPLKELLDEGGASCDLLAMQNLVWSILPLVSDQKGFAAVRRAWPWPAAPKYAPFPQGPFTLAPGALGKHANKDGRWLMLKALNAVKKPVLLETGTFLGGSMYRWLDGMPGVRVVGLDPFWNVSAYMAGVVARDTRFAAYRTGLAQLAAPSGSYDTCVASLWRFRERACLVPGFSPRDLLRLHRKGLRPDVVFFDNDKSMHDVWVAHTLCPGAVLAGDDWGHQSTSHKRAPVRRPGNIAVFNATTDAASNVCEFAAKMGFWVEARHVTWMLHRGEPPMGRPDSCGRRRAAAAGGGGGAEPRHLRRSNLQL